MKARVHAKPTFAVSQLLPHRPPMCWLDDIVSVSADAIVTSVLIRESAMFYEHGLGMPSWVGIEYMAQTGSALAGYERACKGLPPLIGLLLGTRRYTATVTHLPKDALLQIHARVILRDESDLVAFDCEIVHDNAVLARGDLKAIQPEDIRHVLDRATI